MNEPKAAKAIITGPAVPLLSREPGILAFNERVLAMAEDPGVPLLERVRYLGIVSSNLDEFFEIRVSGLKAQIREDPDLVLEDGTTVNETMRLVCDRSHQLVARQYALFNDDLVPLLEREGIVLHNPQDWNEAQRVFAFEYFRREVLPILTPIAIDPARPFPRVLNKSLHIAVELKGRDAFGRSSGIAIVQAPRVLPRLVSVPPDVSGHPHGFMLLGAVMVGCIAELFAGMEIRGVYQFRCTRNSDLFIDEEEVKNLRETLKGELSQRSFGDAVRLEVSHDCSDAMRAFLCAQFNLTEADVFRVEGPVNFVRLMPIPDLVDRADLKFVPFQAGVPTVLANREDRGRTMFDIVRKRDILMHHPYESFTPVLDWMRNAVADPDVMVIKQTIYRTGNQSELMDLLVQAALRGKETTAVVELRARFDEETNMNWAAKLEQAGVHVVFGAVGFKTHAKAMLIVRREASSEDPTRPILRRYVHMSTGNYHPRTAALYTDFGMFTSDPEICADVHEMFQQLTGLARYRPPTVLWQSPFTMHENIIAAIRFETEQARSGRPARIIARMNALLEDKIIAALYEASQAGVSVDLIVRGVCALKPGVPGLSDNIRVRSVVGRFLEHSRIFLFHHAGDDHVYLSSADWMDRNMYRRVELAFPVRDPKLKKRVIDEGLLMLLTDEHGSWTMGADGSYAHVLPGQHGVLSAQQQLLAAHARRGPST
ncbi:polyphosphate kinase 1 [soil metagenome]